MSAAENIDRTEDSLLRIADVRRRVGLSTATIYRREAAGTFPRRVILGPKSVAWYESDVGRFVQDPGSYRSHPETGGIDEPSLG